MNIETLKTLGGALNYRINRYNERELSGRDFEVLCSHFKINPDTIIYGLTVEQAGFIFETKEFTLKYTHNIFHQHRTIEITKKGDHN